MSAQNTNNPGRPHHTDRPHVPAQRRAKSTGLIITALGVVLFNIAPFLKWVAPEDSEARSGYETDSLIPFVAYLGLGLLVALVYASQRARRGQHRGLTLVSMAVGLAAALQCLAFAIEPMGGLERGDDLSVHIGVWVALIAALIWTIGSALLAKEIEGDDHDRTDNYTRDENTGR
jgi:peptidoglycan/LPS O-acetylase OafA/YrhL